MLKKLLLSSLAFILVLTSFLSFFPKKAYAQANPWYNQGFGQWYSKVYNTDASPPAEIFGERYTAAQVQWVVYGLVALVMNAPFINSATLSCLMGRGGLIQCLEANPITSATPYNAPPSYKPSSQPVLALMFSPSRSISGVNYVRQKLSNFDVVPAASAQGFGFAALSPIQTAWRVFRDITYALFVIIIIVMAFMIMFRVKLSPQTIITVQSALPKIIISLILVTFSYAIGGFLIDLIYVAIGLLALLFNQINLIAGFNWGNYFTLLTTGPQLAGHGTGLIGWFLIFIPSIILGAVGMIYGATGYAGLGAGIETIIGGLIGVLLTFAFVIWAFVAAIKIFILLIKTYISILLRIVFAPLQIGIGTLYPGVGFGAWAKSLLSDLAVYPTVGALFMIALMFIAAPLSEAPQATWLSNQFNIPQLQSPFSCPGGGCQSWYPPMTFGNQGGQFDPLPILWLIASLGILSAVPKAGELAKGITSGQMSGFALGAGVGTAATLAGRGLGTASDWAGAPATSFRGRVRQIGLAPLSAAGGIRRYQKGKEVTEAAKEKYSVEKLASKYESGEKKI
jgi:hypothetical protein